MVQIENEYLFNNKRKYKITLCLLPQHRSPFLHNNILSFDQHRLSPPPTLPVCAARRNSNTIIFPVFTNVARHRRHEQTEFITVVEDCGRQLKLKIVYLKLCKGGRKGQKEIMPIAEAMRVVEDMNTIISPSLFIVVQKVKETQYCCFVY
ncbi:hypothetical protein QL285_005463 [Trifolium repens]|nr:hypothetical protein QL285_005463 [Trifolium repens]